MGLFRYQALGEKGKKISGVIDADSIFVAKERLRQEQVLVIHLETLDEKRKELVLSSNLILSFTRELGQLLRAGLPLYESLQTIEEKYRRHKSHALYADLCDQLKSGYSLSKALEKYPKSFDAVYLAMVKAAEQTGSLASIFDQLSLLIGRQQKLKKQVLASITYPAFLGSFCLLIIGVLLFFVIPSMRDLFEGRELHPLTSFVLSLSRFVNEYAWVLGGSIIVLPVIAFYLLKNRFHAVLLKIPFVKTVTLQSAITRFCRCLAILLSGGVPLLDGLRLARKVMRNLSLEAVLENAENRIIEGKSLTSELKKSPLIPPLVLRMLAIAEETGNLAPMLGSIADIYEEELEKNLTQMTALLQPVLLLLLGLVVGVVLLSILIPLTDVGSFINT